MTLEAAGQLADELNERAPEGVVYEVAGDAEGLLELAPAVTPFYVRRVRQASRSGP